MNRGFLYRFVLLSLIVSFALAACRQGARGGNGNSDPANPTSQSAPFATTAVEALQFQTGRNDYIVEVDGFPREFIIYVPASYDASQPTPLVIMFHGSNQGGPLMYENTRWKEEADANNIIVIFPTAWKYPLIGETGTHTKWNDITLKLLVEPGTELRDDVHFTRVMLDLARLTFNIDRQRTYATGFSNGGSFVSTRLLPEMSDVFGAFAICGSGTKAASDELVTNSPVGLTTSLYTIIGTNDDKISEGSGHPRPFPLEAQAILADELFGSMLVNTATILSLDPAQYELLGDNPNFTIFHFSHSTVGADNEYIFQMVDEMGHIYPSVDNNRYQLNAAHIFWEFFLRHPLK
jgi:polyhydroxybutyrate depolymerase